MNDVNDIIETIIDQESSLGNRIKRSDSLTTISNHMENNFDSISLSKGEGMDKPLSSAASGSQGNPAITSGAGMFFVVWEDNRHSSVTGTDIYGTRVSSAGAVLDPLGIAICTTSGLIIRQVSRVIISGVASA